MCFALRNYWRGFFAAVIGVIVFRLLSIRACSKFEGAVYVYHVHVNRWYVLRMRGNRQLAKFLQNYRLFYPFLISCLICAVTFPPGPGMFQSADMTTHDQIISLLKQLYLSEGCIIVGDGRCFCSSGGGGCHVGFRGFFIMPGG